MSMRWLTGLSLVSRGSKYQVAVATILLAVLPILLVYFITLITESPEGTYPWSAKFAYGGFAVALAISGYVILRQYPRNIIKLREYLKGIAEGELPDKITLQNSEDDIHAIENYLNMVLDELRRKLRLLEEQLRITREMKAEIEAQQKELLDAERHRAMVQSLGAACHHIGQPATVLRGHLYLLKSRTNTPEEQAEIEECMTAVESIGDILEKLRRVSEYRTVPYLPCRVDADPESDDRILDIDASSAGAAGSRPG